MRKTYFVAFLSVLTLFSLLMGCKGNKVAPVSERIAKVWTASKVDENSTTVYTKGGTNNIRNYTGFKLDLSAAPTVKYTEYDGNTFTGQYSLPDDNTLKLTNLNPSPTGDNGTITFTINSIDDSNLKLTRTTASQKTGNTTNVYTLTNP
ncbi:hypothetical protein GO730_24695 [Spirosoma sp. HMF3257]|uniref:Lipocalin-like domain-containing protein n=1 Tax=Spirosoma telluris TaxID=2183553 RepID=A0A327NRW0_9BACT|nr:hypothetical protein [Spirosoma telluris]RAI76554.1 hypothetical protein HMF3257_24635 [Spirosoma telluris]